MNIFFINNTWHEAAANLGANPIFFGSGLKQLALGDDCHELHLAATSMDWTGDIQHKVKLAESLRHSQFNSSGGLLRHQGPGPRFTLNIQEDSYEMDDHTRVRAYDSLFCQKSDELTTCVLYYNEGQGLLEHFYIPYHQLPWKRRYTIPLQYSLSAYDSRPLDWVVVEDANIT
ncbi:hypothetical protein CORC01_14426 [Colletotrichum orchidophilum]|uniref:Uncharacterized protein n=1 Tax=Colletotrichum orchidophilum TaxID=1209926 RepID=A0A1G4AMD2_9PEZI|nr:uncharacterized protein CORC01_14426 [Colletotrichum orchidophilum]OHE90281.1 hypothetical protein CORC01_14426 [Colletotrichum orchidophilum]